MTASDPETFTHTVRHTRPRATWRQVLALVALALGAALIMAALYGRIMGYALQRDEPVFVAPAALMPGQDLYSDLFYPHLPYSAWLFHGAAALLPGLGLLGAARLVVFLGWLLLLGGAGWLGWRLSGQRMMAVFAPMLLLGSGVLMAGTGMTATNSLLPLPFALWGLGLIALALAERHLSFRKLFLAGLCLTIAAGMSASALGFIPAVMIACVLLPREMTLGERLADLALPVALGGITGALPLIWLALTEPGFFDHILHFYTGPHLAYWRANAAAAPGLALEIGGKLRLAQAIWMQGAALLGLFLLGFGLVLRTSGHTGRQNQSARDAGDGMMLIGAAGASVAALAFLPTPGFAPSYAPPLVALVLMIALIWRGLAEPARPALQRAMAVGLVLMIALALPRLGLGLNALRHPEDGAAQRLARGANALRAALPPKTTADTTALIATLSPLYPLEAGLAVYPEFATGPLGFRSAAYTAPDLRARYVMAGPADLADLFAARPPAALLTGFDPVLEAPLEDWARAHGYRPRVIPAILDRSGMGQLWLPAADAPLLEGED